MDNAFATNVLQRPMDFGADVVAYSATKMMDGQGRVLAGAVCGTEEFIEDTLLAFTRNTGPTISAFNAWVASGLCSTMVAIITNCIGEFLTLSNSRTKRNADHT